MGMNYSWANMGIHCATMEKCNSCFQDEKRKKDQTPFQIVSMLGLITAFEALRTGAKLMITIIRIFIFLKWCK